MSAALVTHTATFITYDATGKWALITTTPHATYGTWVPVATLQTTTRRPVA